VSEAFDSPLEILYFFNEMQSTGFAAVFTFEIGRAGIAQQDGYDLFPSPPKLRVLQNARIDCRRDL